MRRDQKYGQLGECEGRELMKRERREACELEQESNGESRLGRARNTGKLRQLQLLAGCAVVGRMEGNLESQRARMVP